MQAGRKSIFSLVLNCETAASQVKQTLVSEGYDVIQSFNFHSAIKTSPQCLCAEDPCFYQMIVLLVYPRNCPPISLILYGNELNTTVSLTLDASHPTLPYWITKISDALAEAFMNFPQ
jgi:hypothetical protein